VKPQRQLGWIAKLSRLVMNPFRSTACDFALSIFYRCAFCFPKSQLQRRLGNAIENHAALTTCVSLLCSSAGFRFLSQTSILLGNRFLKSGAFFSGVMRTAPPCDWAWDEIGHTILTYSGRIMSTYRLLISNKTEELLPTTTISVADVLTTGFGSNSTAKLLLGVSSVCMRRVSLFLNAIEKFNHGDSCIWGDHSAADLVFYHTGRFSVAFGVLRRRRPVHRSH